MTPPDKDNQLERMAFHKLKGSIAQRNASSTAHLSLNLGVNWRTLRNLSTDNNGFVILP